MPRLLLADLELGERLVLDLDDTLFHKCGRKVNGAASFFRDPIRSRGQHIVFAHGLNLVVLTLRVRRPGAASRSACPSTCASTARAGRPCSISARP